MSKFNPWPPEVIHGELGTGYIQDDTWLPSEALRFPSASHFSLTSPLTTPQTFTLHVNVKQEWTECYSSTYSVNKQHLNSIFQQLEPLKFTRKLKISSILLTGSTKLNTDVDVCIVICPVQCLLTYLLSFNISTRSTKSHTACFTVCDLRPAKRSTHPLYNWPQLFFLFFSSPR